MINALNQSIESKAIVDAATKYLQGVKDRLAQRRKPKESEKQNLAKVNANGASDVVGFERLDSRIMVTLEK